MNFTRAENLFLELSNLVDNPIQEDCPRIKLSATLAITSMHFSSAVRVLCKEGLLLGASSTLRSQFESLTRSIWALHRATDTQVEKLSAELNPESQQASKNIPSVNEMMGELEKKPQLANLLIALKEFKESSWIPLNSFVHSGLHAVYWTRKEAPPQLLDQAFRASNGLALLAFQNLGILTGRPGIQKEIIQASACYSDCLPKLR